MAYRLPFGLVACGGSTLLGREAGAPDFFPPGKNFSKPFGTSSRKMCQSRRNLASLGDCRWRSLYKCKFLYNRKSENEI